MSRRKTHEEFVEEMKLLKPDIKVIGIYKNAKEKIKFQCLKDGFVWKATPDSVRCKSGCPECSRQLHIESNKKRTMSHNKFVLDCSKTNPNIKIIGKYTKCADLIECQCKKCGGKYSTEARKVKEGRGCPFCAGLKVQKDINSIYITNPEIIDFLKNKTDAYIYTKGITKKVEIKCPDCGYETMRSVFHLTKYGFSCPKCSDGVSYPNKFSRAFLSQLPVKNVQYEYSPKWAGRYRYDNYFEFNNKKYILEMDGAFHYIKYYKTNLSIEETSRIDNLKDLLAKNHNIEVIRIDCFYSNPDYIVNNIIKSELNNIFDLSLINWTECKLSASKNFTKTVCDYYNKNKNLNVTTIGKYFNLSHSTITNCLCIGTQLGLCDYKRPMRNKSKPIVMYNELEELNFSSVTSCEKYLKEKYKTLFSNTLINKTIKNNSILHGYYIKYA